MKLFYSPGACSVGIHVILEEIGKPYEAVLRSTRDGSLHTPEYIAVNPKSKVPALQRDDGSVLTEFPAIAFWLARTNPFAELLPTNPDGEARAIEAMDYIGATMHMQGFARLFRPTAFNADEGQKEAVQARGREILGVAFALQDIWLGSKEWVLGPYSVADAALFFVEVWSKRLDVPLPPRCEAHFARMKGRPAVQRVIAAEGLDL